MSIWRRLRYLARAVVGRRRLEGDVNHEVQFHLDARAADLMARGLSAAEARRRARLEFGGIEGYREATRQAAGLRLLTDLRGDLIYALRVARRQPTFVLAAIISLALGIGANTLVFSVANGLLFRPLPVRRPDLLVTIESGRGTTVSFPTYRDLRDRNTTFEGIAGFRIAPMSLEYDGTAGRAWGYLVTGNYFDLLGVSPMAGRFFHQDEDQPPAQSPLAVISYDYWMARFGGERSVVGSTVRLNGMPYTVLGIAPRGFRGTEVFYRADIWVPMTMQPQIEARTSWLDNRGTMNTMMIGRLRPGIPAAQVQAQLDVISAAIAREHPASDEGTKFRVAEPGLMGDALRAPIKAFSLGLLVLAGLVLLMACVNLGVMLVARGADRRRELAIRLSIGASRGRIVRQLLAETTLLAVAGGGLGLALAVGAARALSGWRLPVDVPVQFDVTSDVRVFLFGFAVAIIAGLLFGVAPALTASRTDAQAALKGLDAPGRRRRWAIRDLLVTGQVASCCVLVAGCLLALRGLQSALTMPIGFKPDGLMMAGYDVGLAGYAESRGADFEPRALDAVRHLPGIESAAYGDTIPLYLDQSSTWVMPDNHLDWGPAQRVVAAYFDVSPGFFETMGTRLLKGRPIEPTDTAQAPLVAVVNQTFARRVFQTMDVLGRRFSKGGHAAKDLVEVVGVVEDGKYQSLSEDPRPALFEPIVQNYNATISLVVRSALPADEVGREIRGAFSTLDPSLALYDVQTVNDMLGVVLLPSRAAAIALGAFGVLAIVLALTGLHGIVSNAVVKRQKEIGIRLAIGARPSEILRLVVARTVLLLVTGAVIGLALVFLGSRLLASVVYEASPKDPLVLAAVGGCLLAVGFLACWAPVRRSLRMNTVTALRAE